ncbi:hypothetical protein LSTR_LSTR011243 [Laodelphax striatellus]|uniref:Uncharacterized protein n=1 Tax=Laodelphax striatellus TaxID=195883 RepID=A0A482X2K6_LAOST|nr:hypothetical protein LSTR_LSTR011243 [Laodelphax striatellus]
MDRGGAAATLSSADLPPGASSANGLQLPPFHQQQPPQKTTTLSTIVVNSGSTRVVIALVQCLGERDVVLPIGVDFEGTKGRTFLPRAILRQQNRTLSEMEQSSKVNTFYYRARQYSLIAHPEPPASSDPPPPLFRSYSRS